MTSKSRKTPHRTTTSNPVDDEGQVTPSGDALSESEAVDSSAGAGTSLAQIAAALRAAGVARTSDERGFTRDEVDTDIGTGELLKLCVAFRGASLTAMSTALDHVKAIKAMDAQTLANFENNGTSYFAQLNKSDAQFHSGLLKAYSLETDNEVISTLALAKIVDNLVQRVDSIASAIEAAG